jgi:hypothetical protein
MLMAFLLSTVFVGHGSPIGSDDRVGAWRYPLGNKESTSNRPSGPLRDEEIAQDVRFRLDRNGFVDRHQVAVTVIDGTVYLTGTVDSPQEKLQAEYAAASADGVIDVVNRIRVPSEAMPKQDTEIRQRHRGGAAQEPALEQRVDSGIGARRDGHSERRGQNRAEAAGRREKRL